MNARATRSIKLGILLAMIVLVGMVALSYRTISEYAAISGTVLHTHEVRNQLTETLAGILAVESGSRGYVITGNPLFLEAHAEGRDRLNQGLPRLRRLVSDNAAQITRLDELTPLVERRLAVAERNVVTRRTQGLEAAVAAVSSAEGKEITDRIRVVLRELQAEEDRLFVLRLEGTRRLGQQTVALLAGGLALNALLVLVVIIQIRRDWRARNEAAQLLRASADEVAELYHRAPCGYLSLAANGTITHVNDTALRWLGRERPAVVGRLALADLLAPADRVAFPEQLERLRTGQAVVGWEFQLVRGDGEALPVVMAADPVRGADGRLVTCRATLFDDTARRQLEQVRAQALAYAESIVETVREPLVILTQDLQINRANRAYYACFQSTPAETEGREFVAVAGGIWQRPALLADLVRVLEGFELEPREEIVTVPGVGAKIFRVSARKLYRPGNHVTMMLVALEDVTAQRAAQEELERFFRVSLDFMCISSADGYFKRVSPAVTDVLGWTVEEFLRRPYIELVHPEDQTATLREVESQVKEGRSVFSFENRYRHKAGGWRVLSWKSVPQPGGLMYATARDVTERKEHERLLRRLHADLQHRARELEAANTELEAFSNSVSHDLRAPLRHIDGFASLLRKQSGAVLDATGQRYLDTIGLAARNLGVLIDELLTFSRMGRAELRWLPVDMSALVAECVRALEPDTRGREIEWIIPPLPTVHADPAMLRQVWSNLLGNAVKYTRRQPRTRIELAHATDPVDGHTFSVRDNGAGFDMQYAGKLFGVFQRLHSAGEFEGTGIGLANVRRIIARHGGRTWAEGAVEAGATFYFTLPAVPPGAAAEI